MNHPSPSAIHGSRARVAFVQARWHAGIVDQARQGFLQEYAALGGNASLIDCLFVPGAFELPLKCRQLIDSGDYGLVVAAGLVVDGGIYRHEFVAQAVISGLMQVQLESGVPVLSVVLTPKDFQPTREHEEFFTRHFVVKGQEAARAVHGLRPEWFGSAVGMAV